MNREITVVIGFYDIQGHDNVSGTRPSCPLGVEHISAKPNYASDASAAKTSGIGAAAELLATRGPRRSLRIERLWHNAPSLAAGQAPWYRLVLFGEEDYEIATGQWEYGGSMSTTNIIPARRWE